MSGRVKLCAIAMNEGPYLVDWVFHHLRFGFDGVEIWVNGSHDPSLQILRGLRAVDDRVELRDADDLLKDSVHRGKYFQYRAYTRQARKAAREGYTHIAFLDLDEYWLPRDFASGIHDFLPGDSEVNVVSFPWYLDVPDHARAAFSHPLADPTQVRPDPHVKSVVRLDDRAVQFRPHTARTTSGTRLLVRDPFPLVDERAQQWGSFVPADHRVDSDRLPEAFVLHAIHRSETEYVGSLTKVIRRSPTDSPYRTNRRGYVAHRGPTLSLDLPTPGLTDYFEALARFRAAAGVDDLVQDAELHVRRRAESVLEAAVADRGVMERLRGAFRGLSVPELDRRYPGWDHHLEWHVDEVSRAEGGAANVAGWAYFVNTDSELEFAFRDAAGHEWPPDAVLRTSRPDVARVHPGARPDCGFQVSCPAGPAADLSQVSLLVRPRGGTVWSVLPLPADLAGARTSVPVQGRPDAP